RFYENCVAKMIRDGFPEFEDRIAVGIAGEGSDCFGYDDEISRDHDFGTGVCLWVTDEDMKIFGYQLSVAYNELVDSAERSFFTERLRERRGVMTIHDFYSNILQIDCDVDNCRLTEDDWLKLDHSCLKTAVNGEVFRDDSGKFTAFRNYLLNYYPDRVWKNRIAEQLHDYASSLQVNYARCMTRGDIVAAELCRSRGLRSAMELFFLLRREYPPYYKWTFRALNELDLEGRFSSKIRELAGERIRPESWEGTKYHPTRLNYKDTIVSLCEEIASEIEYMLAQQGLIRKRGRYLEIYVDEILGADN
ncbi:MAG: DUF4037 domain-containing protein, partial [Clostridia bacterium]|nr:DUF4037 domain-containing protein [Clostridia bacterium]